MEPVRKSNSSLALPNVPGTCSACHDTAMVFSYVIILKNLGDYLTPIFVYQMYLTRVDPGIKPFLKRSCSMITNKNQLLIPATELTKLGLTCLKHYIRPVVMV